jgi:hypothetical protein
MGLLLIPVTDSIDDGYTLDGKIEAVGPWPEVNYRYRHALPAQVYEFLRASKGSAADEVKAVLDLLFKHLKSWDVREKEDGETVPISLEILRRVPHRHQQRMVDRITGYSFEEQGKDAKN